MATHLSESERLTFEEALLDESLASVMAWIEHFLCAPNTALGRLGDVCPFAKTAMLKRAITFYRNYSESVPCLARDMEQHMEEFQQSAGMNDVYQCRIIVPNRLDDVAAAVEAVQMQLKPAFVERHMMIGQFFQACEEPGLWSKDFRPLQSPVPLLAIRNMVPTDIAFLHGNDNYVRAYLEKFGKRGSIALAQFETAMETRQ
ncbi:DUF6875 domain-containing protein [Paraburkholderia sp. PREW-6R]|uniref:DUF6875 domain-containing protein n=1 Tax=Paraburkholderia sp. PREW-6R TaxID=3141544 RepID=UPI0031F59E39